MPWSATPARSSPWSTDRAETEDEVGGILLTENAQQGRLDRPEVVRQPGRRPGEPGPGLTVPESFHLLVIGVEEPAGVSPLLGHEPVNG
jgi:hypothetical protein